jgi:hypothetical protein
VTRVVQSNWFLAALLAVCVARLWLMALPSSFWVDEMGTVFVVQQGADHPSFAVAPQVPDSLYYWLPRASSKLLGQSEVAYRVPSILAAGLALWLIARLAARLIHPRAGWFAAFACLGLHDFNEHAADARPYALGMCVAAACVWFLVRWLDTAHWRDGLLFAFCGALLWPIHLIYWPFYLVLGLYTGVRLARHETPVAPRYALAVFALMGMALVPVALRALRLMHNAGAHVILALPSLHHFEWTLRWKLPLIAGGLAWLLGRMLGWKRDGQALSRSALVLVAAWWLGQPVCLFAYSYLTGNSAYVPRYFSISLPGLALAATFAARPFFSAAQWKPMAALVGTGALALLGQWTSLWPQHQHSDWRGAAAMANREAPDARIAVICTSPFVEGQWPTWRPDYPLPGFLYAQLPVYPLHGRVLLFPFERGRESEQYAASLLPETLTAPGRFLIYGGAGNVRDWRNWFAQRPELDGWDNRLVRFGDVYLVLFSRR